MNSDLAYFNVSHNIEILYLINLKMIPMNLIPMKMIPMNSVHNISIWLIPMIPMNLKMKLINNQKKKIEPMEPTLETLNLGNDENPCLIKIGSTLNDKERKDLKELLKEFKEVFVWSYEDMPSINPEIA